MKSTGEHISASMDAISVLRDALIDLPRKELQAKAKTIGIAANLKTSEIIELILQHSQKNSKEPDGEPDLGQHTFRVSDILTRIPCNPVLTQW
jgi:hypothetical protein